MPIRDLRDQIGRLPEQPGVYLYFNTAGDTIYVGKARILKDRVRSYLSAYGNNAKTNKLLDEIVRLEIIVTDSVVEALALESNLIKQRAPRYNILLRDDKNYPYLKLTTSEAFPRVLVDRQVVRDGNVYAGPFLPSTLARKTMLLVHRLFGLRSCNEVITGRRDRPCLEYDINRCVAPCVSEICSSEQYDNAVSQAKLFLEGKTDEVIAQLRNQMQVASTEEQYERAAHCRDLVRTVEALRLRQQKMMTTQLGDHDAFGMSTGRDGVVIQVFQVRRGKVVERVELAADDIDGMGCSEGALIQMAVQQFYVARDIPPNIHIPVDIDSADSDVLERWLAGRAGRRVRISRPKRGDKRGLLELASRNAMLAYASRYNEDTCVSRDGLEALRDLLHLPSFPHRIECFDISTIQGRDTVGSMVVCTDGRMQRSEYRKFRVRGLERKDQASQRRKIEGKGRRHRTASIPETQAEQPAARGGVEVANDFDSMEEVVLRRYRRLLEEGGPFPDLVVVDGGRGQLTMAYRAFEQLGLSNLVAIGIAKKEEELFVRGSSESIRLPADSPALHIIQRARDEAHRFAVTFHRRTRSKRDFRSELDLIPGVGSRRKRVLLERFGSVTNIRRASREELLPVIGPKMSDAVIAHFTKLAVQS